jgi:hypothetical protein
LVLVLSLEVAAGIPVPPFNLPCLHSSQKKDAIEIRRALFLGVYGEIYLSIAYSGLPQPPHRYFKLLARSSRVLPHLRRHPSRGGQK